MVQILLQQVSSDYQVKFSYKTGATWHQSHKSLSIVGGTGKGTNSSQL